MLKQVWCKIDLQNMSLQDKFLHVINRASKLKQRFQRHLTPIPRPPMIAPSH